MNHDQIRREARAGQAEHDASMPAFRNALSRFLDRESRTADQTSSLLIGGLTRRSLFRVGGVSLAGAALLAACGSDAVSTTGAPGTGAETCRRPR